MIDQSGNRSFAKDIQPSGFMRSLLICHHDAPLDHDSLARWLASFSTLAGVIVITETSHAVKKRVSREWKRSGPLRFLDILAFRVYYKIFLAKKDAAWTSAQCAALAARYPSHAAPAFHTSMINTPEVQKFIREAKPDIIIARCKHLLKKSVYGLPTIGTFVMHPGMCPEYRNAHGCFWALARRDVGRVGMTLLKIDDGIDTGPVYGFYSYLFDERRESHIVIQTRTVLDNLSALAKKLTEIAAESATPIDVSGHESAVWGQPWLSKYLSWKYRAWRTQR